MASPFTSLFSTAAVTAVSMRFIVFPFLGAAQRFR
jgi:hypothetical protein